MVPNHTYCTCPSCGYTFSNSGAYSAAATSLAVRTSRSDLTAIVDDFLAAASRLAPFGWYQDFAPCPRYPHPSIPSQLPKSHPCLLARHATAHPQQHRHKRKRWLQQIRSKS